MSVDLVATERLGNLNDPSYELLLRRELGGVFEVDELLLDWDQADARLFVGVDGAGAHGECPAGMPLMASVLPTVTCSLSTARARCP